MNLEVENFNINTLMLSYIFISESFKNKNLQILQLEISVY